MKRSKRNSPCKEASSNAASSSSKNAGTPEGSKEIINCENNTTIASRETRAVNFLRILVLVLLGMTACLTSIGIYRYTQSHEVEMFETEYEMNAYRIIEYFNDAVERKLAAINAMSTSITSSALDAKEEFPFVTIPDFALKGADLRIQADAIIIHWMPLVTDETREEWETYSLENRQQIDEAFLEDKKHRIKQDIEFGLSDGDRLLQESPRNETILDDGTGFHPRIYSNGATVPKGDEEDGSGPYLPLWQRSPINDAKQKILNLNFANTAVFRGVLPAMLEASKSIISRVVIPLPAARERMAKNLALSQYRGSAQQYVDDPVSFLAFPVFDTLQEDRQLAGVLATNVYWKLFLTGILPQSAMGYYCTLTNSFNQTLAYRVDGPDVTYLGEGDFHDTRYDHLEAVADINTYIGQRARPETRSYTSVPLNTEIGKYQLHVYPTQETEDCFISNRPSIYATIVASIFLFNALVFLLFVWFVERRQRIVMDRVIQTAEKSASQERELNLFLAHEVRNPLSAALAAHSFVASAVKETISEPVENNGSLGTLEDDVAVIGSSLCFIDDFLRSMLDMNRAVANKLVVKLAPADLLKDVLEPVCNILSHRGFGVNVLVDCPQNLIVNTDALRLKQVLLNLGRNSAKFVNSGFIRFRAAVVQGNVEVYVEDSGPGIPLQKRGNLFQKFQSSLDVLSQGTGIGLSLCKSLIDLLQGEIWLDDTYDSGVQDTPGARFVIQLFSPPLSPGALLSSVETASSRNSVGVDMLSTPREMEVDSSVEKPSAELPEKLSVLFVDDDIVLRKLFVRSLRTVAPAWAIEEAANGETALQLTETEQFDLIFMDQYMASTEKQLLGTETVRALRAKGITSKICGLSANDIEEAFLAAGSDFFVLKPLPCKRESLQSLLLRICFPDST